jgi:hypothetical protein
MSSYSGNAVNLYNTNTATYQDIGFDGSGNLNASAITSFCGSPISNCYLYKWYDQSGHGNDLTINTIPTGGAILSTCGSHYCFYLNGYASLMTGSTVASQFYLYSFTSAANAVFAVDATNSGTPSYGQYMTLYDFVSNPKNDPALWSPAVANSTYSGIHWDHNGSSSDVSITSGALSSMFSWWDSYYQNFELNGSYLPSTTVVTDPIRIKQVRTQAYGFELGNIGASGGPYEAGWFSEVMLWPTGFSAANLIEIHKSEATYFGVP